MQIPDFFKKSGISQNHSNRHIAEDITNLMNRADTVKHQWLDSRYVTVNCQLSTVNCYNSPSSRPNMLSLPSKFADFHQK